ncbi:MAG TPA: Fic family protein [Streptosporangiaceae bacterium]|nr:Fic family protein [Streptosporangiaceae bacterium]
MVTPEMKTRAGRAIRQPEGYSAFIPASLPPDPPLRFDSQLATILAAAGTALGRLDGVSATLPNPELFVAMYVRREAVLSSQIEGTQSTLDDVLAFEIDSDRSKLPGDIEEVVNYVNAMNYGLTRLETLPLSLRLLKEIHGKLLAGGRGSEKSPGEFRPSQNWIGGGRRLADATFIPSPPHEMNAALGQLERFLHDSEGLDPLIVCALAHAQFETVHPFLDGNGRVGRLLIAFLLCHAEVLQRPVLYLSHYLKAHRGAYYDRLMAVRYEGDWEGWLRFFLTGVATVSREAERTARRIVELREQLRRTAQSADMSVNAFKLLDHLFEQPIINVKAAQELLEVSFPAANGMIGDLQKVGVLTEITGGRRNRLFRFDPYLDLFADVNDASDDGTVVQPTQYEGGESNVFPGATPADSSSLAD